MSTDFNELLGITEENEQIGCCNRLMNNPPRLYTLEEAARILGVDLTASVPNETVLRIAAEEAPRWSNTLAKLAESEERDRQSSVVVTKVSRESLVREREALLERWGVTLEEFTKRAKAYALVGDEWQDWSRLQDIAFLLGEERL